jgi:hypothetical protein
LNALTLSQLTVGFCQFVDEQPPNDWMPLALSQLTVGFCQFVDEQSPNDWMPWLFLN